MFHPAFTGVNRLLISAESKLVSLSMMILNSSELTYAGEAPMAWYLSLSMSCLREISISRENSWMIFLGTPFGAHRPNQTAAWSEAHHDSYRAMGPILGKSTGGAGQGSTRSHPFQQRPFGIFCRHPCLSSSVPSMGRGNHSIAMASICAEMHQHAPPAESPTARSSHHPCSRPRRARCCRQASKRTAPAGRCPRCP